VNILLLAYYFPPINSAGSVRPQQMARWLGQYGHSVSVLTHGYDPGRSDEPGVIRVPDPAYVRDHRGRRFWNWFWWRGQAEVRNYLGRYASIFSPWQRQVLARADEIGASCHPDLIIATYPPLEDLTIGLELSRRWRVPLVSDFRDGLLFRPIEEKRLRAHRCVQTEYTQTEAAAAAASSLLVAVTPTLQEYFRATYPECRCETVFNGYDPREWLDLPSVTLPPGAVHLVHTGRIALSDSAADLRPLLAALRRAGEGASVPPLRLHLVGEYSKRERAWTRESLAAGIVTLHPLRDRRTALAFQRAADLLLLVTRPGLRSGIPLKLFEYLAAGRPILALTDDPEVRRITEAGGQGWCVSPRDETGIAALLRTAVTSSHPESGTAPQALAAYSWEQQMGRLERLLPRPTTLP